MTVPLPKLISSDTAYSTRLERYAENRRLYAGEHVQREQRNRRPRYRSPRNYIGLFADTIVAHMGAPHVSFGVGEPADTMDAYHAATLAANDAEQMDYDAEVGATVTGDGVWKVTYDEGAHRPRVVAVDPARVWAQPQPGDPHTPALIAEQYQLAPDEFPAVFGPNLKPGTTRPALMTEAWTDDSWQIWENNELRLDEPNPYGVNPYVLYPNIRTATPSLWGVGDPWRLRDLQDTLNQANEDLDAEMRLAGTIVVLEGVTDSSDIAVQPGSIWTLPEEAKAYLLDYFGSGGPAARLTYAASVRRDMHALARIPEDALGATEGLAAGNLSGIALQVRLGPLIRLVARKRLYRSAALRRRAQLIAALGVQFDGLPALDPGTVPAVTWTEAVPSNRADELSNGETELRLGRSRAAVLRSVGVEDPGAELAARRAEAAALPSLEATRGQSEPAA